MDKAYNECVADLKNAWKKFLKELLNCLGIKV